MTEFIAFQRGAGSTSAWIIEDAADHSDAANQAIAAGWHATTFEIVAVTDPWVVTIERQATVSDAQPKPPPEAQAEVPVEAQDPQPVDPQPVEPQPVEP